nr:MAG TPA: L-Ala-D-Glu peptidase-like protein [Caudoviricetes sp.]
MRNVSQLHPELQKKVEQLKILCQQNGITIGISECVRTVAEQNVLYAKGRTMPGKIVTKAKGNTYSSMHQWGVAFDFYLKMDVDGDGSVSDDALNNSTELFNKVGKIGQSIGLEWGGAWKSMKDLPHFQLPNWGSTPAKLKRLYGTPEKFMATWKKKGQTVTESNKITTTTKESEDYNMKTIKKGSKGNAVKVWQIIIGAAADGIFGSGTESATKTWQSKHGLAADGIVGKMSWKAGLEAL